MRIKRYIALLISLATAVSARAQEATSWTLGGSLSTLPYTAYAGSGALTASDLSYGSTTTLDLDFNAKGGRARAEASIETAVLAGAAAQSAWAVAASPYARPDELLLPAFSLGSPAPPTIAAARVRTLYLKMDLDWASVTAGRQVINYERGALWSPTDIFTELDLTGLSPVRLGSDALRFVVPLGMTGAVDLAVDPTTAPADGRYALRLRALVGDVDGAMMAARDGAGRGTIVGVDFKADLGVGFYADAAYELYDSGQAGIFKAAAGADYSFGDLILAAEYYYNGGGTASDPVFPGSHNLYGSIAWTPDALLQISATGIWDVSDSVGTATLMTTISAAQNATVGAYVQASNGQAGYGVGYGLGSSNWIAQTGLNLEVKF